MISKTQTLTLLCLLQLHSTRMVGGFSAAPLKDCQNLMKSTPQLLSSEFSQHQVISCEKQIVNGINHKLKLQNSEHSIQDCDLVIWHDFKKSSFKVLEGRGRERDCYTLLKRLKKTENEEEV